MSKSSTLAIVLLFSVLSVWTQIVESNRRSTDAACHRSLSSGGQWVYQEVTTLHSYANFSVG